MILYVVRLRFTAVNAPTRQPSRVGWTSEYTSCTQFRKRGMGTELDNHLKLPKAG
jgi:hypothetical protein